MQTAAPLVTSLMAASLLGGCASGSTAAGQANSNHPVVVVTTAQSATKRSSDKPAAPKIDQAKVAKESERLAGILGVLRGSGEGDVNDVFGGVVGGVGEAFGTGGLGVRGVGISAGGAGGLGGLGTIGTIGHGSGFGRPAFDTGSNDRAKVKFGNVVVTGPLMVDVVQRHVDDHRDDVQSCHRLEQAHAASRWGSVTLRFTIDETGRVSDVHVYESTLYSRDLESCIAHAIGAFEFPRPGSGGLITVLLPISF